MHYHLSPYKSGDIFFIIHLLGLNIPSWPNVTTTQHSPARPGLGPRLTPPWHNSSLRSANTLTTLGLLKVCLKDAKQEKNMTVAASPGEVWAWWPVLVWGRGESCGNQLGQGRAERAERILSLPETRHFNTGPSRARQFCYQISKMRLSFVLKVLDHVHKTF